MVQVNGSDVSVRSEPRNLVPGYGDPLLLQPTGCHVSVALMLHLSDGDLVNSPPPVHVPVQHPQTVVLEGSTPTDKDTGVYCGMEVWYYGGGDKKEGLIRGTVQRG